MRVFTRLRQMLLDNEDLRKELEGMRRQTDERFRIVFETLDQLLSLESKTKRIYPVKSFLVHDWEALHDQFGC